MVWAAVEQRTDPRPESGHCLGKRHTKVWIKNMHHNLIRDASEVNDPRKSDLRTKCERSHTV